MSPAASHTPAHATPNRRLAMLRLSALAGACALPAAWATSPTPPAAPTTTVEVEVWKDPQCGCCQDWIDHMQANGFRVTAHNTGNAAVRAQLGLPQELGSCHTALVGGYLLEGHVPASDVRKLLTEKPRALGLTVPGMPVGSPGMDGAVYAGRKDPYDVLLVRKKLLGGGVSTRVFTSYRG